MLGRGFAREGADDLFLIVNDEVELEGEAGQPSGIGDLFIKRIALHNVHLGVTVADPGEMVVGHRPIGTDTRHDDLISTAETSGRVRHAFPDTYDQVGKGYVGIDLDEGAPVCPPDDHVFKS